jgi:hypothetical protein
MTIPDYIAFGILIAAALWAGAMLLCEASYNECAAMPDQPLHFPSERETNVASILKSRFHLWQLRCDLHDTVSRSRETISQSLDLIA